MGHNIIAGASAVPSAYRVNQPQTQGLSEFASSEASGTGPEAIIADLISGGRPELNEMLKALGQADGSSKSGDDKGNKDIGEIRKLLKNVLKDGVITKEELAQILEALKSYDEGNPSDGSGPAAPGAGAPSGGGAPAGGAGGAPPGAAGGAPAGGAGGAPDGATGGGAGNAVGNEGSDVKGAGSGSDKSVTLGATTVNVKGGTPAERAKTIDVMEQMYQKDPAFKQGIDSKADKGIDITIKDLPSNIAGLATVGGNTISLDPNGVKNTRQFADTIAHEVAHNLGLGHGEKLESFAERASATVV